MKNPPSDSPLRSCGPALLPPLVVFVLGCVWGSPQLSPDTATGLLAWHDFVGGGPWNCVVEPSPADLATTIANPVTWWSPGQYAVPGLLISAGLSSGLAFLIVALCSAWSFTLGVVRLARELGAPADAAPWMAFGAAGAWHTLYAFGFFIGGEVLLAAVWPWIFLAAWRLRGSPVKLVCFLPPLLLLGSFAKHSFAIYALGLLAFLGLEAARGRWREPKYLARAAWPLAAAALLYALGRAALFASGPSPSDPGQSPHTLASALGFSAVAPILAATGGGSLAGRAFALDSVDADHGWRGLGAFLAILSPLPLFAYLRLAFEKKPLSRLTGLVCLVTCAVLGLLVARGAAISLEDRHYRPAGALLLVLVGAAAVEARGPWRTAARALIIATVVFGFATAVSRHRVLHRLGRAGEEGFSVVDCSPAVQAEIRKIGRDTRTSHGVLYLPYPPLGLLAPTGDIIASDARNRGLDWIAERPYLGEVPALTLVLPAYYDADGRGDALRASFRAWRREDWTMRPLDGWNFWTASTRSRPAP